MKAVYQLENTEEMEATLTVTMRIREWKELAEAMPGSWPHWKYAAAIRDMVTKANKAYAEVGESKR